jgi:hypothetical protein
MEGIASTHTDEKPIQFHVKCVDVWNAERLRIITPPRDSTSPLISRASPTADARRAQCVLWPHDHLSASPSSGDQRPDLALQREQATSGVSRPCGFGVLPLI